MPLQSWNDESSNSIMEDQSSLASLGENANPEPKFYDEPYQPSQAHLRRLATQAQADKAKALSGEIQEPSFSDLAQGILGGAAGVDFRYQKYMAKQALPVMQKLQQAGGEALRNEDWDTTDQVVTGMNTLAGKAPQYAKQAEAFMAKVNEKRNSVESNKATLDFVRNSIPGVEETASFKAMYSNASKMTPTVFNTQADKMWPELKISENSVTAVNKGTGVAKVTATPTILGPKDLSTEETQALGLLKIKKETYLDFRNKQNTNQPLNMSYDDIKKMEAIQQGVQQKTAEQVGFTMFPATERVKGYSPGSITANTGAPVPGIQQQAPAMQPQGMGNQPQQPRPQAFPQPTNSPATALQGRYPKPNLGPSATLPTDITVEEAKQLRPDLAQFSDKEIARIIKTPEIRQDLTLKAMDNPGLQAARERIRAEAEESFAKEQAQLEAKRKGDPLPISEKLYRLTKDGSVESYSGESPTINTVREGKWFHTAQTTDAVKKIEAYNSFWSQATDARQKLVKATPEDFDAFNKLLNNGVYLPIQIFSDKGGITVPGTNVSLSRRQALMWNTLVSTAQANEQFTNPEGKANANIADFKGQLTSMFATRDTAIRGLTDMMTTAHERIKGLVNERGAVPKDSKPDLPMPGWYNHNAGGSRDYVKKNVEDKLRLFTPEGEEPVGLARILGDLKSKYKEGESTQKKQLEDFVNGIKERTGINKLLGIMSPPVNPDTVKSLKSFRR